MEIALANGSKEVDVELLASLSSHIQRIAETFGLNITAKGIKPTLSDIIKEHATKKLTKKSVAPTIEANVNQGELFEEARE
jgi:hypothetical protein